MEKSNTFSDFIDKMDQFEKEQMILQLALTSAVGQIMYLKYLAHLKHDTDSNVIYIPPVKWITQILTSKSFTHTIPDHVINGIEKSSVIQLAGRNNVLGTIAGNPDIFKIMILMLVKSLPATLEQQFAMKFALGSNESVFREKEDLADISEFEFDRSDWLYVIEHAISEMTIVSDDINKNIKNIADNSYNMITGDDSIYVIRNVVNPYPLYLTHRIVEDENLCKLIGFVASTPISYGDDTSVYRFTTSPLNKLGFVHILS